MRAPARSPSPPSCPAPSEETLKTSRREAAPGIERYRRIARMRILVVEDDAKAARLLGKGLREEGFAVDVAHDGDQGDELLAVNTYEDRKSTRLNSSHLGISY